MSRRYVSFLLNIFLPFLYSSNPFFLVVRRSSLSRFHLERVQRARLFTDRSFRSLVTLERLATWGLGPKPSIEALAHELTTRRRKFLLRNIIIIIICFNQALTFFFTGIATIKENKGKGLVDEETLLEAQSQPRPFAGDKRKIFSKTIDLGDLPSRRGHKKMKHESSKSGVVKPGLAIPPCFPTTIHPNS